MRRSKIQETFFANSETLKLFFQTKSLFHWRRNPSNEIVTVEEEMDGIDKDSIENLMDLSRLRFTDEECVNLKLAVGTG